MKISFDHFNLLAPLYDSAIRPRAKDDFWEIVKLPDEGYLLDAGGGTGRVSQFIKNTRCHIIISDLSFQMLGVAKTKSPLIPVQSSAEFLSFQSKTFDRIIMVDAFHHLINQELAAYELWRVLKPGGSIIIEEPDINKFPVILIALAEKLAFMRSHFLTAETIMGLFHFPEAIKMHKSQGNNFWICIEKPANILTNTNVI